ncbi:WD40 repeat domain-containing serine/threonine protein kinase [Pseudofrankia saprophytica]|uniref:WD40 repeat domain-containing serine/threonine protein kinase n=1 Tax=Pseudofrankia saprophytica TaxID=298655 RepID=UPI000234B1CC|nr:serine/threonine-protein kinase [Pseudofrankia saprophytica]
MAPAEDWKPGDVVLGLYEVLDVVHSGGMGVVHRVRHRGWQIDMAVKTPRSKMVRTPDGRARFEAEAATWVKLGLHPHTVACAYVRTIDDVPRVFAEWVDGGSLAQAVSSRDLYAGGGQAALGRILDTAVQMAWGLAHAHAAGLVHMDVKPANVMLEPDGTAKVTDFGVAKARAAATGESAPARPPDVPVAVSFGGMTPAYCSPEQAAAAVDRTIRLTAATDVWSWAVTVLEMFAGGRSGRHGPAAGAALDAFLRGSGVGDPRIPPMPADVAVLLRECFAADPAARPASLVDLAARLHGLYPELVGAAYERPAPRAARLLADGLSNQALSFLDLGGIDEAEALWLEALGTDPYHLPSVYNLGLHRWRSGRQTGEELVANVEAAMAADGGAQAGRGALLLGAAQLERHEDERAGELLRAASVTDPGSADVAAALAAWEHRPPRIHAGLEDHGADVSAVASSADGGLVLSGDRAGGLLLWAPGRGGRRARRTLTKDGEPVTAVAMDTAGTLGLAVRAGAAEIWDLRRGRRRDLPRFDGDAAVVAVAVSGDGRYVATGSARGVLRVWEASTPRVVNTMDDHMGAISSLALSHDGTMALSASFGGLMADGDGTVRAWDVARRTCTTTLVGPARGTLHGRPVRSFPMDIGAVSADARCAVVAWWKGPLTVFDARRRIVVSEAGHRWRSVTSLAVSSAGPTVLTAGDAAVPVQVWDATTGRCLRTLDQQLPAHARWVHTAAVSADGRVAVLGIGSRQVAVRSLPAADYQAPWCYARPRAARELTGVQDVFGDLMDQASDLTAQGRFSAAAEALRSAQGMPGFARHPELRAAWARVGAHGHRSELLGAWQLYSYNGHGEFTQPTTLALRADGLVSAIGWWTGEVDVWDFAVGERLHIFNRGEGGSARDIRFALGGALLVVLTSQGMIQRLSLVDGSRQLFTDEMGAISAFALMPTDDDDRILIGDKAGVLRLRRLTTGALLRELRAHGGAVHTVALSPDGRYAASLGGTHQNADESDNPFRDSEVKAWSLDADQPSWTLPSHSRFERLDFSADSRTLFLCTGLSVGAWDVASGELRYSLTNQGSYGTGDTLIAFSADHGLAATPDRDALRVWATDTGEVRQTLALAGKPRAFALSADGSFAVTAGGERLVQVWDVASGRCLRTLEGHSAPVTKATLSEDGTLLATTDLSSGLCAWGLAWDFTFPSRSPAAGITGGSAAQGEIP